MYNFHNIGGIVYIVVMHNGTLFNNSMLSFEKLFFFKFLITVTICNIYEKNRTIILSFFLLPFTSHNLQSKSAD